MSRYAKTCSRASSSGFTLLEVLVAFVILAVSLGVLWRSSSDGLASLEISEFHALALAEAKSQIDRVGSEIPLEEGELSGLSEAGLSWVMRLRRDDAQPQHLGKSVDEDQVVPYELKVIVADGAGRTVSLTTLRLAIVEEGGS